MPGFRSDMLEVHDASDHTKRLREDLSGITTATRRTRKSLDLDGTTMLVGDDAPAVAAGALGKVDRTAQVANIASTALSSTPPAGLYAVEAYLVTTTADAAAGTLALTVTWTDAVGARTGTLIAMHALAATGLSTGRQVLQLASGDIAYAVTITGAYLTSAYAVFVRTVALG